MKQLATGGLLLVAIHISYHENAWEHNKNWKNILEWYARSGWGLNCIQRDIHKLDLGRYATNKTKSYFAHCVQRIYRYRYMTYTYIYMTYADKNSKHSANSPLVGGWLVYSTLFTPLNWAQSFRHLSFSNASTRHQVRAFTVSWTPPKTLGNDSTSLCQPFLVKLASS